MLNIFQVLGTCYLHPREMEETIMTPISLAIPTTIPLAEDPDTIPLQTEITPSMKMTFIICVRDMTKTIEIPFTSFDLGLATN